MKKIFVILSLLLSFVLSRAQGVQLKKGNDFPDISIQNLINAPVKSVALHEPGNAKIYILNFWGTWCSPCLPEMDNLAKLQTANPASVQIIGISDEVPSRLQNYLKKKPSKLWLASDTTFLLYKMMAFSYVGQSAIIDRGKIVALVRTDSINQTMINKLIKHQTVNSSAEINQLKVNNNADIFAVDTTLNESFTVRSYMIGQPGMARKYLQNNIYKDRRITFINGCMTYMFKDAYGIKSEKQVVYEVKEKDVCNFDDKQTLYCLDLLVKPSEKDSLLVILQKRLNQVLPIKARIEYREMPVYALINKQFNLPESQKKASIYGFSGKGYEGESVSLADFADEYLSNEMDLPVIDETGLNKKYDIKTVVELRNQESIVKSIQNIGLDLVKKEKKIKVLILYK